MSDDPYAALLLTKTTTAADIKKTYRKLARSSHPELQPGDPIAEARFKTIQRPMMCSKTPQPAPGSMRAISGVESRIPAPPKIEASLPAFMEDWREISADDPRKNGFAGMPA